MTPQMLFAQDDVAAPDAGGATLSAQAEIEAAGKVAPEATDPKIDVLKSVHGWAEAWSAKNTRGYLAAYAADFKPDDMSRAVWKRQRRDRIGKSKIIEVALSDISVSVGDESHATVSFTQGYRSDGYRDKTEKTLQMVKRFDHWLIAGERVGRAVVDVADVPAEAQAEAGIQPDQPAAQEVTAAAAPKTEAAAQTTAQATTEPASLRFDITGFTLEGATLLTQDEIDAAVKPFTGKDKDFSDVQRALEAVEETYSARGFSAVRVSLPEQELEKGTVRFAVIESRFGKVTVKDNRFVTEANVLNALPSLVSGGVPRSKQIARELKFANEIPSRQLSVVMKAGEKDELVDANIIVTDSQPSQWIVAMDNTGTAETGRERIGVSYRHANLFGADHVGNLQYQTSPRHPDRVRVLSGGYRIPLYGQGDSVDFSAGYSNVNSILGGGLDAVKGGGLTFATRYTHSLDKMGSFEPRLVFGLDWRKFNDTLFNGAIFTPAIVVRPLSLAYFAQGRLDKSDLGFNASYSANLPGAHQGTVADFAALNPLASAHYKVARYGASYQQAVGDDWKIRVMLNGQYSPDTLVSGEQMRLGGSNGVRGFSEGSAGGESGRGWNLEGYTPDFGKGDFKIQALAFFDTGEARATDGTRSSISGAGLGLRAGYGELLSLRLDAARIINDDADPLQKVGDWRVHVNLSVAF
jgi:hemolysin activation/secretion protein